MKHLIILISCLLVFSCKQELPPDLQELKLKVNNELSNAGNKLKNADLDNISELKESIYILEKAYNSAVKYDEECSRSGFERNNKENLLSIENQLDELKKNFSRMSKKQAQLTNIFINKRFRNKKNDSFGYSSLSFRFYENGTGNAAWSWSVGTRKERGSSDLEWEINGNLLTVYYEYESDYYGTSSEKIVLYIDENDESCLYDDNDRSEKFCR